MVKGQLAIIFCILALIFFTEGNDLTTEWSPWLSCSHACYQGTRSRIRFCEKSDNNCTSTQDEPCNTNACLSTNTAFRDTACNATCNNTGWLKRERYCLDPTKPLNKSCEQTAYYKCTGSCDATSVTTTAGPGDDGNMTTWIAIGASAGFVVLLIIVIVACVCYKRKQRKDPPKEDKQYENGTNMQTLNREEESDMIEEAYGETYQATETTTFTTEPPVTNTTQHNEQDLYARPKKPRTIRKEKNEDAYNELHGKSSVKAQEYDTTDHFSQTMPPPPPNFTSEAAYNEIDERNYENSGQVSDENEYEIMAGQATAYSTLETDREDGNESEYNRLQHPTVAVAYDITE